MESTYLPLESGLNLKLVLINRLWQVILYGIQILGLKRFSSFLFALPESFLHNDINDERPCGKRKSSQQSASRLWAFLDLPALTKPPMYMGEKVP